MSNEKTNLDINIKSGSKTGSFVAGGVIGAAVAGGAAYASTGELDGLVEEVKEKINDTFNNEEEVTVEATTKEESAAPVAEAQTEATAEEVAQEEEIQPVDAENEEPVADNSADRMQKLEDFINDHNNERIAELNETTENEAEAQAIEEPAVVPAEETMTEEVPADTTEEPMTSEAPAEQIEVTPVETATNVNDNMSFGEAFAAARAEVGSGGVFEWHGSKYNTFTAEEWNDMSSEEKSDFQDRVFGNNDETPAADTAQAETPEIEVAQEITAEPAPEAEVTPEVQTAQDDIVEVIPEDDIEIEVLGIEHNDTYDIDLGEIVIGDQEIVLVDLDGDGFDVAVADIDGDGTISSNEIFDISDDALPGLDLYADSNGFEDDIDSTNDIDMSFDA